MHVRAGRRRGAPLVTASHASVDVRGGRNEPRVALVADGCQLTRSSMFVVVCRGSSRHDSRAATALREAALARAAYVGSQLTASVCDLASGVTHLSSAFQDSQTFFLIVSQVPPPWVQALVTRSSRRP